MAVKDWSTTAGSNTGILSGITLDGSVMTPTQVDNAFRDMAAQIASQLGKVGFKGADISSASPDLSNATGWYVDVTGTTTITAFGTVANGQLFILRFTDALLLTHNASSLILPGGASFTTAAGDVAFMMSLGSGNWRCVVYQQAASAAPVITPPTMQVFSASATWTKPTGCTRADFEAVGGGGAGGSVDGQGANTGGAGGGGASGFYGRTGPIDVSAVASAAVTIGAAGIVSGSPFGDGGFGGNTTITIGATTYTWGGGFGGGGQQASGTEGGSQDGGAAGTGTNVVGSSQPGGIGVYNGNTATNGTGGNGGSSPFGSGGKGVHLIATGQSNGGAAAGFGAGGAGGVTINTSNNGAGSAGRAGYMRVLEYYS